MRHQELDLTADIIDVRDIIARVEELETIAQDPDVLMGEELGQELDALEATLADLAGNGGDEQWRGDWYPLTLIRESHFKDYAQELAEDIGAVNPNASWPNNCIDWGMAAHDLRMDYTSTDIGGVTYYFR